MISLWPSLTCASSSNQRNNRVTPVHSITRSARTRIDYGNRRAAPAGPGPCIPVEKVPICKELCREDLEGHPKYGASWEGFALEQVLAAAGQSQAFFWGTNAGAELDLLLFRRGRRYGVEFKAGDAPGMSKSLRIAIEDLQLHRAWIVHPGETSYRVDERVEAVPLDELSRRLARLA